ncbi:MAG: type I 3-dehydroquinate dehydratase [Lachnospiraceae bacterium]|nr:type I 3-dehydroquinate dehydratase [Lachnospiraceae bacterium]
MKGKLPNLNDGALYVTIPVMAVDMDDLREQAQTAKENNPDMIEWRSDALVGIDRKEVRDEALQTIRGIMGDTPILFTCRDFADRGKQDLSYEVKKEILEAAVTSDCIDVVDIELPHREYIPVLRKLAHENGVLLLIAHHDWNNTPSNEEMTAIVREEYDLGADILKYSFAPQSYGDVARVAEVTLAAKADWLDRPVFSISGGEKGMISRICGRALGTNLCFASIGKTMQVHIADLRKLDKMILG